ncbi:MAG TPA: 4Fe-4S ferredoxin [bacterium]|nr:4Fe-4S ferredoxin [bacterium]
MPAHVDTRLCDGCREAAVIRCEAVCPGDLMAVDPQTLKAFCRNPLDCWDCCACVKACPTGAVTPRLAYALALFGGEVLYEGRPDGCRWTFADAGGEETFDLPADEARPTGWK